MLDHPVTVTADALATLLRTRGGEPHVTLADSAVWEDPASRDRHWRMALTPFIGQGLATASGPSPELSTILSILNRPAVEYYGWFTQQKNTTSALAVAAGSYGLLALRQTDRVTLTSVESFGLAEALLAALPRIPPARGSAINVARDDVRHAADREDTIVLTNTWTDPRVRGALDQFRNQPSLGAGEFYVAVRNNVTNSRTTVKYPICYHDTTAGRWWLEIVPGYREEWVVAAPATPGLLVKRLHEAHWILTH